VLSFAGVGACPACCAFKRLALFTPPQAAKNFQLGDASSWRKADILADCVVGICNEPDKYARLRAGHPIGALRHARCAPCAVSCALCAVPCAFLLSALRAPRF